MKKCWRMAVLVLGVLLLCPWGGVWALSLGDVQIHGFVSQGYLKSDDVNYLAETEKGTYQFNEAGLNFNYTRDKLRVGAQVFSRDLGDIGNNDIVLDWGLGEYRFLDEIGVRAGRIKMAYGLYNQGRDVDLLRTPVFLPQSVYEEGVRDLLNAVDGFGLFGNIDARFLGDFEYEGFAGATEMGEDSIFLRGTVEMFERGLMAGFPPGIAGGISNVSIDNEIMAGGAVRWGTPLPGLRLGASYLWGENAVGSDISVAIPAIPANTFFPGQPAFAGLQTKGRINADSFIDDIWVYSLEYLYKHFTLAAEYTTARQSRTTKITGLDFSGLPAWMPAISMPPIPDDTGQSQGWYIMGSYQLYPWLTLGLNYNQYYSYAADKDGQRYIDAGMPASYAWQKEWVPTVRFDPIKNWVIKGEVHFVDGSARCYEFNNPNGRPDDWILYAIKTSYSF